VADLRQAAALLPDLGQLLVVLDTTTTRGVVQDELHPPAFGA